MASFINQGANWRWTWYVCLIWTWVELVLVALFVPETYAPAILRKKAKRLRKETGNQTLRSQRENHEEAMGISIPRYVASSMGRPFEILLREIMALLLCLWCALLLGILYAFFSAFPIIFSAKGFNEGEVGLAFVGIGIGICLATLIDSTYWTSSYVKLAHKLGHKPPPEAHLRKGMVAAVIGPISLFWFAWTCQPSVHWAIPIVSFFLRAESPKGSPLLERSVLTISNWLIRLPQASSELHILGRSQRPSHTRSMLTDHTLRARWEPTASCARLLRQLSRSSRYKWLVKLWRLRCVAPATRD